MSHEIRTPMNAVETVVGLKFRPGPDAPSALTTAPIDTNQPPVQVPAALAERLLRAAELCDITATEDTLALLAEVGPAARRLAGEWRSHLERMDFERTASAVKESQAKSGANLVCT